MRQLYIQLASARFDGWLEIEQATIRAVRAVKDGDVSSLDNEAAKVLSFAESGMIRILPDEDNEAAE